MKCLFHSADLDGHCSGALVKLAHPDCEMIGINYGQEFDLNCIEPGEKVFMVDFALQPFGLMLPLIERCDLRWIDHHATAIQAAQECQADDTPGLRQVGKAACELVWEYLHTGEETPLPVRLLGRYDVWDMAADPRVLPFQFGIRTFATDPRNEAAMVFWESLLNGQPSSAETGVENIVRIGNCILQYKGQEDRKYLEAYAFETNLDGHRALAMNRGLTNSQAFDYGFDSNSHEIMIAFSRLPSRKWTVSLYSATVDVGRIAKRYGGGGHKGAAGFQADKLPFAY